MVPASKNVVPSLWCLAPVLALALCMFGPLLLGDRILAFRDGAHFYPPLWRLITSEWRSGRPPLWNPYENLGQPLLANPAAAVCYPGQLLLLMPVPWWMAVYIYGVGHLLLAAGAAFRLARAFRASAPAAGLCALAYAFSGAVLMQHANAPFLVGAAWLPLAILGADRIVRRAIAPPGTSRGPCGRGGSLRLLAGLAVPLALMVLGGDPQMAYQVGVILGLYLVIAMIVRRRRTPRLVWAVARRAVLLAGGAAVVALILSAVQVFPSAEFGARSDRAVPGWGDRLCGRLEPKSHHERTYHFSVGPWRLAEFLWPNVSGRQYPVHRRWLDAVPAEGRIWTPTLYMGVFPVVFALVAMRFRRRGDARQRWLCWTAVGSTLASFGYYGLGWLLAELHVDSGLGGPFGGVYWLMNLLLPGYLQFRYPAKLLVVTSLALSLLAARGWDMTVRGRVDGARRLFLMLGGASLVGLLGGCAVQPFWAEWLAAVPPSPLFGPLDAAGAWRDMAGAFGQTALLCAAGVGLLGGWRSSGRGRAGGRFPVSVQVAVLLLAAIDLGWSNAWLVATAPRESAESDARFAQVVAGEKAMADFEGAAPARVWRHPIWMPPAWSAEADVNRLAASMRFDRDTLWPNYNLDARIAVAEVSGTMMLRDYAAFLARHRFRDDGGDAAVLDFGSHAVLPPGKPMPPAWLPVARTEDAVLWRNRRPLPWAWIAAADSDARPRSLDGESCRVTHHDPQRVEIEAVLVAPGLVVLAEQFYPGWQLEVIGAGEGGRPAAIERVRGVLRAARLPAGRYRLTFRYQPQDFVYLAGISAAGWLALALGAVAGIRTRVSQPQSSQGLSAGATSS